MIAESASSPFFRDYAGGGDGGLSDGGNCREFCYQHTPPSCGSVEVVSCGPSSELVDGGPAVRCEYRGVSCPYSAQGLGASCGRRPAHWSVGSLAGTSVGDLFARMAELEGASVAAFEALARELAAHGAPMRLVRAAERAARDEERHYDAMGSLARDRGAEVDRPHVDAHPARALLEVALENAREGCVRETYGALVALWQAQRASDPGVRATLSRIARDEARHAALAWEVDAWARSRLSALELEHLEAARVESVATLARELAAQLPSEWVRDAGLPDACEARALFDAAHAELWSNGSSASGLA